MRMICTMHMCAYVTPKYIQYIHALFNTYTYAYAGSLMIESAGFQSALSPGPRCRVS
jgi:hypothetical protein